MFTDSFTGILKEMMAKKIVIVGNKKPGKTILYKFSEVFLWKNL